MAKQTKSENLILYICDFRRGGLNVRLYARIQPASDRVTNIG